MWDGDWNWCWNAVNENATSPYHYAVIWFMQLIADSNDLFHECDDGHPANLTIPELATTPLYLKPDCITLGKWCRAWTGHVISNTPIQIQYRDISYSFSVEQAFLFLSYNRVKIDFKDETTYMSLLRGTTVDEQRSIVTQWLSNSNNCITDQHFCYECNGDPNHCKVADGCVLYKVNGTNWCP